MIDNVRLVPLENPRFVKPVKMLYTEDGVEKSWELVQAHDSVAALIYNRDAETFVLVKQFRPPIFLHNSNGYTYELCAGILDKDKSLEQTMAEEISEETGYRITADALRKVSVFFTAVGFAGSRQTLFYAEVGNADKIDSGGGIDNEQIEVVELSRHTIREFMYDESLVKTSGLLFALYWFFDTKEHGCYKK
ncbi:NUDIX domain-containing protein [Campylobacterota bacterium]|nr:NUDIX domain-containing protein [Campylobacterota bacterium]